MPHPLRWFVLDGRHHAPASAQDIWNPHTGVGASPVALPLEEFGSFFFFHMKMLTQTSKEELANRRKSLSGGNCKCLELWQFLAN